MGDAAGEGGGDAAGCGAAHLRALEAMYAAAPSQRCAGGWSLFVPRAGAAVVRWEATRGACHAAGYAHGASLFKMLDDAAFFAAQSAAATRFVATSAFMTQLLAPVAPGEALVAEGTLLSSARSSHTARSEVYSLGAGGGGERRLVAEGLGTFVALPGAELRGIEAYAEAYREHAAPAARL